MILFLTAVDKDGKFREFFALVDSLEKALDFLSRLVSIDSRIVKAELEDNGNRMVLPTEAIDGQLLSPVMKGLEREWRQILATPVAITPRSDKWLVHLIQRQTDRQNNHIIRLELAIKQTNSGLQRAQAYIGSDAYRSRLIDQYTKRLNQYKRYLAEAQASLKLDHLQRLQAKLAVIH